MASSCLSSFDICVLFFFFFNDTATTEMYTLSLHDALPISCGWCRSAPSSGSRERRRSRSTCGSWRRRRRSEEHTSELQSRLHLVCRLLLEKKKKTHTIQKERRKKQKKQKT